LVPPPIEQRAGPQRAEAVPYHIGEARIGDGGASTRRFL
jgi:hypothetical protein